MRHGPARGLVLRVLRSRDGGRRGGAPRPSVQVLAYHAIADLPAGSALREYSVPPAEFGAQLDTMRRMGYRFIDLGALLTGLNGAEPCRTARRSSPSTTATRTCGPSPPRSSRRAASPPWPSPSQAGWVATNDWDAAAGGERLRLLDGEGLRSLRPLGIEVGAHSMTHRSLTASLCLPTWPQLLRGGRRGSRRRLRCSLHHLIGLVTATRIATGRRAWRSAGATRAPAPARRRARSGTHPGPHGSRPPVGAARFPADHHGGGAGFRGRGRQSRATPAGAARRTPTHQDAGRSAVIHTAVARAELIVQVAGPLAPAVAWRL